MFGSNILEIVIGLVFIYLLYSLLATTIKEGVAALFSLRAKMLEKAIKRMLDDGLCESHSIWGHVWNIFRKAGEFIYMVVLYIFPITKVKERKGDLLVHKFYDHPGIKYLAENKLYKRPSYISPENFSKTVVDILKEMGSDPKLTTQSNVEKVTLGIERINELDETKKLILSLYDDANRDLDKFRILLEQWFNETMNRAGGWYKKQSQKIILLIGFVIAITFNVDTISIVKKLSNDKEARKELADLASSSYQALIEKQKTGVDSLTQVDSLILKKYLFAEGLIKEDITNANTLIGLGWDIPESKDKTCDKVCFVMASVFESKRKLLGYIITALAISFGAPFWFDLLSKLMQLRGSGKKPEDKVTENIKQPEVKRVG